MADFYDLTCKKTTELEAGSGAAVAADKFILLDASDGFKPVVRTIQDLIDLSSAGPTGPTGPTGATGATGPTGPTGP